MKTSDIAPQATAQKATNSDQNSRHIQNHMKIAEHLKKAADCHEEAAKHHESGNFEKASVSTIIAQGHVCNATDLQRENAKNHAAKN